MRSNLGTLGVQLNFKLEGGSLETLVCKLPQNTPGLSRLLDCHVKPLLEWSGLWGLRTKESGG